jgi:hypothetical protein
MTVKLQALHRPPSALIPVKRMMRRKPTLARMHGVDVPDYLLRTYWWAYVHPKAVRLFERSGS